MNGGITGALPDHLAQILTTGNQTRHLQVVLAEIPQHGVRAPQLLELREDQSQRRLHIGMRIQLDTSIAQAEQADWQHLRQFAFAGLVQPATLQPRFDGIQLGFAECTLQSGSPALPVLAVCSVSWLYYTVMQRFDGCAAALRTCSCLR